MLSVFKREPLSSTECVDRIQDIVYEYLKPMGFCKYGRTFHRFAEGDISQVIHLQNGSPSKGIHDILWVNVGIRVPECAERSFTVSAPMKKYYREYECNIRNRLGFWADGKDTAYDLRKRPEKTTADMIARIKKYVMPAFDALSSRDAILLHRADFPSFDLMTRDIKTLDEAMIFGRRGDMEKASELFNAYYHAVLAEYHANLENGTETYLRKGDTLVYRNAKTGETETVTAEKDSYVTAYHANRDHINDLEALAQKLGIVLK